MVARPSGGREVAGSNPVVPTKKILMAGSIKLYYTTCGKIVDARKLAKKLLESKSAVCVNIIGDIESHFLDKKKVSC